MRLLRKYKTDFLIVAGLIILPLLLYGPVTLGGKTMLPADNLFQWEPWAAEAAAFGVEVPQNSLISDLIIQNYPWKRFILQSVQKGEIPLWNPYLFAGAPFLAAGQHSAYYPFSLLFLILPLATAYGWFTVSQLWLAGVMMYILGRTVGLRRAGAALAGLIYQGCGFMLVSAAVFPMIIAAAVWLPLLMAAIEKVIQNSMVMPAESGGPLERAGRTAPWIVIGAAALGLQILAGHVEITYYTLLVMALFAAWRLFGHAGHLSGGWRRLRALLFLKPAVWLLILVTAGMMLGAIQFIPLYEVASRNFREGSASLEEVRGWAFPPRHILAFGLPNFFGNPTHQTYYDAFSGERIPFSLNYYGQTNPHGAFTSSWGIKNYVEGGVYLGILSLLLALLGVYSYWRQPAGQRSVILFLFILALLSLAFIFGTPLYALLYYGLPGINQLHSPFRWVFPLSICAALLAGYGLDYVRRFEVIHWRGDESPLIRRLQALLLLGARPAPATLLAGLAFWTGLALLAGLYVSRAYYHALEPSIESFFLNLTRAPDAFPHARAFYSYQFINVQLLGLILTASAIILRLSRCPFYLHGQPLWLYLAAFIIGLDLFLATHGFNAAVSPDLLEYKPAMAAWLQREMNEPDGPWRLTSFTPHGNKPFNANAGWLFSLQDVRGYDSIIPKQYTDYMAAIEPQNELLFNRIQPIAHWESLNSPLLDLLGVKYVITTEPIDLPKYRLAWEGEGARVYENLGVVPRAYTLPQTAAVAAVDSLAAMQEFDPRYFVIIERDDWPAAGPLPPQPPTAGTPGAARVTVYGNIEVWVDAQVEEPAWLILNDSHFPGWRAFARPFGGGDEDEQALTITRVNGNFRGVLLEPGAWTVRYRYSPLTFQLGGLVSVMGGIILLFILVVWGWRRYYRPEGELTNTRSIAKNSLVPMGLNLFNRGIDFVFAAFYLRVLGPFDAGSYATAIAIAGWFEIIANWGLNTLTIREVSQDRSQASRYLLNTAILRLGTSLIGSVPIFIYWWGVRVAGNPLDANLAAAILLLMAGMVFSSMGQGVAGLFYAFEEAERPAAIATVTTILKVGFGVAALLLGFGFVGLAAVSILVNLITLVILVVAAFRRFPLRGPWRVDFKLQRQMVYLSYPLMINHLFAVIFFQVDIPILQQFRGDAEVGWYNSAYKWVNAFNVIPAFFTFALFPVISRQIKHSIEDARRTFRMSIKLMVLTALPLAVMTTFLAHWLIFLLGGNAFLPHGAIALQLIVWSIPFGWLNSVTNYVLIALGQERMQTKAFIIGVGFNLITNLIFIPRYGYVAAAITTIVSEIVLLAVFNHYLKPKMPGVGWLALLWKPLAAALLMTAAMWAAWRFHLALAVVVGLLVYPLGLWLLRVFGQEERHILQSILPASLASRLRIG